MNQEFNCPPCTPQLEDTAFNAGDLTKVPHEILEAARKVEGWTKTNWGSHWELAGLCSRDRACDLATQLDRALKENSDLRAKTSLEGYRALGAQVAAALDERDEARRQRDEARESRDFYLDLNEGVHLKLAEANRLLSFYRKLLPDLRSQRNESEQQRDALAKQVEKMSPVFDRAGCLLADLEKVNADLDWLDRNFIPFTMKYPTLRGQSLRDRIRQEMEGSAQ